MNAKQQQAATQQEQQPGDAQVSQLEQLYLAILIQAIKADRLTPAQQQIDAQRGRLWLMSTGTTVPIAMMSYQFAIDSVTFEVQTRDERKLQREVKYAEGLDGFVEDFVRFLQGNRLAFTSEADFRKRYDAYAATARRRGEQVLSEQAFRAVATNAAKQLTSKTA